MLEDTETAEQPEVVAEVEAPEEQPEKPVAPPIAVKKPAAVPDPLKDAKVLAAINAAKEQGRKEAEAAAKQKAEREAMDEASRLRIEKEEAAAQAAQHAQALAESQVNLGIANTLLHNKFILSDPNNLEFLQFQVTNARRANPTLTAEEATVEVLEKHSYLVRTAETPKVETPRVEAPPTTVAAAPPKTTQTTTPPAAPKVDTLNMSKKEYAEYTRKTHGY